MPVASSRSSAKPPRPEPNTSPMRGRSVVLVRMNSATSLALEKSSGGVGDIAGKSYLIMLSHSTVSLLSQGRPTAYQQVGHTKKRFWAQRRYRFLKINLWKFPKWESTMLTYAGATHHPRTCAAL